MQRHDSASAAQPPLVACSVAQPAAKLASAVQKCASTSDAAHDEQDDKLHVTIWNRVQRRKIGGNAAPLRKNLARYLREHVDCEVYVDQANAPPKVGRKRTVPTAVGADGARAPARAPAAATAAGGGVHVAVWNRVLKRKVAGKAAPLAKNLSAYLRKNVHCEMYQGQDVEMQVQGAQRLAAEADGGLDAADGVVADGAQAQVLDVEKFISLKSDDELWECHGTLPPLMGTW